MKPRSSWKLRIRILSLTEDEDIRSSDMRRKAAAHLLQKPKHAAANIPEVLKRMEIWVCSENMKITLLYL
jgi:hypothetical protein